MASIARTQLATAVTMPADDIRDVHDFAAFGTSPLLADKSQSRSSHAKRSRPRQKPEGLISVLCDWLLRHQIGLSVNLVLLLFLTHTIFPRARPATTRFFRLSYYDTTTGQYYQGWDDMCLVAFWIVVFTGLRAATMDYVLKPFAQWKGLSKRKTTRFSEQAWLFIYYMFLWPMGMYIYCTSPYFFNLREIWTHFPDRGMSPLMKWYYLLQFAFWLQQIVVVHIEERRKDHWQMFTHHCVTSMLLFTSYGYYQTKVGNVILCLMDQGDILLAVAKMFKYCDFSTFCDGLFGLFILDWFVARHVMYMLVCWSIYAIVPQVMPYGCYDSVTGQQISGADTAGRAIWQHIMQPFREQGGEVCFNERIRYAFLTLLGGLQVLTLLWFCTICQVAYRVLSGQGADDARSDDEDGDEVEDEVFAEEDMEKQHHHQRLPNQRASTPVTEVRNGPIKTAYVIEEEVGGEEIRFTRRGSARGQKRKVNSRSSGIHIPGHSEPKELLGRIGCERPI